MTEHPIVRISVFKNGKVEVESLVREEDDTATYSLMQIRPPEESRNADEV